MVGPAKSTAMHPPEVLLELYQVSSSADLAKIAATSPTIVDLLVEVRGQIERFFGRRASPRLFLERDPDYGTEQIVVGIHTSAVQEDYARMERFDQSWWVDAWSRETANICATLDTQ